MSRKPLVVMFASVRDTVRSAMLMRALTLVLGAMLLLVLAVACSKAEAHPSLANHALKPKRLEVTAQIDMRDSYYANPQGERNPTIRVPAGKTVGLHIHNEGGVMHELAIGRKVKGTEGYEEVLTEKVPMDLFFYYDKAKVELEDATFGELEVEAGIKDMWARVSFPAELKGEWEIGCFVPGHYEAGMHSTLIIE
ncbi:MAG: hypothetical protein HY683_01630 [Chloroflexi bacterium]|nr:hypothetical protein [Chloroflexota bacterium]